MAKGLKNNRTNWASNCANKDVADKYIIPSANYDDINTIQGVDPLVKVDNIKGCIFRETKPKEQQRLPIGDYCHLIYGWLLINPKMLSISDYFNYPKDNAPYIYTLDEVLEYDSDEIYNLLQERLTTMMLRRQIDRESALAVLREKYGWQRDNEQNINLNTNAKVSFKFGDQNLNQPQLETDNEKKE